MTLDTDYLARKAFVAHRLDEEKETIAKGLRVAIWSRRLCRIVVAMSALNAILFGIEHQWLFAAIAAGACVAYFYLWKHYWNKSIVKWNKFEKLRAAQVRLLETLP